MSAVMKIPEQQMATTPTPADLLRVAASSGADPETLRQFMALHRDWQAEEARKAFVLAMTELKAQSLTVRKDRTVSFSGTHYTHSSLAEVVDTVVQAMARVGLSHRWTIKQDGGIIAVACVITHRDGHSESVEMLAGKDDSGKKNQIQQIASTVTYLQRYTLMSACGLASRDMLDDDGQGAGDVPPDSRPMPTDTDAQVAKRKTVCDEAAMRHSESVAFIKERIEAGDLKAMASEWALIPEADQMALWLAHTKGGIFTTQERATIKAGAPKE